MSPRDVAVLAEARERAARRDWTGLRTLATHPAAATVVELGLLICEAELRQGETTAARQRLATLVTLAEDRHDRLALRKAINMFGASCFEQGDLPEAESAFERALREATREDDHLTAARATNNLGLIANIRGRHEAALAMYRVALPAYQRLGFAVGMGETSHNIAITLRDLGQFEEADRYERRAIDFGTDAGNVRLAAMARTGRAEICLRRGEAAVAAADARRAVGEYREIGDHMGEADALRVHGLAQLALGGVPEALVAIEAAIELAGQAGATLIRAESLEAKARVAMTTGDTAAAAAAVNDALALYSSLGADGDAAKLRQWWAEFPTS